MFVGFFFQQAREQKHSACTVQMAFSMLQFKEVASFSIVTAKQYKELQSTGSLIYFLHDQQCSFFWTYDFNANNNTTQIELHKQ